jgi:FAD/FMN-containing dehydrogenase
VQQIVLHAISQKQTVKAIGSRHSIQDIICTDGIPISMSNINYTIDNGDGTVTFGAGIELNDAMEFLESINKTLIMIPAFGNMKIKDNLRFE